MSLLATAKVNGVESHAWLTDVLTRLPTVLYRVNDTLLPLADRAGRCKLRCADAYCV